MRYLILVFFLQTLSIPASRFVEQSRFDFGSGLGVVNPSASYSMHFANTNKLLLVADQESKTNPDRNGRVFVLERAADGLSFTNIIQEITAGSPNVTAGSFFPHSIDVWGKWLAIGIAHNDDISPNTVEGAVEIWEWDNASNAYQFVQWIQPATNIWDSSQSDDEFGMTCVLDDGWLLVGSPWADVGATETDEGAVYFYELVGGTNWTYRQGPIWASDSSVDAFFGIGMAIKGTNAFIAANGAGSSYKSGYVYWFTEDGGTWSENGKVTPAEGNLADMSLNVSDFDGTRLILSAPVRPGYIWRTGRWYEFQMIGGAWSNTFSYLPDGNNTPSFFDAEAGYSAGAFAYPYLIAKARSQDSSAGYAEVWKHDGSTWSKLNELTPNDLEPYDRYGQFSATDGTNVYVVATGIGNNGGTDTMRIYVYSAFNYNATTINCSVLEWPAP